MDYIDEVFGAGGLLAQASATYEARPGQIELARAFDRAIRDGRPLLAEGPTGLGKSFATLVPAIYHTTAGGMDRAIVVTPSLALQDQLIDKDLPYLQSVLPWDFTFALLKGRSNYLCRQRLEGLQERLILNGDEVIGVRGVPDDHSTDLGRLWPWIQETAVGDRSEVDWNIDRVWYRVSMGSDDCVGKACPHHHNCFTNVARASAFRAQVVAMNYHVRFVGDGAVTPKHNIAIYDEAHTAPEIARNMLGWTLTVNQLNRIARWLRKNGRGALAEPLEKKGASFFERLGHGVRKKITRLREPLNEETGINQLLGLLSQSSIAAAEVQAEEKAKGDQLKAARAKKMVDRITTLNAHYCRAKDGGGEDWVLWVDGSGNREPRIEGRPIEVAEMISRLFFENESTLMISATMTAGNSFQFIRGELGVPREAGEVIAPSPFDLRRQGALLVPNDIVSPPKYGDRASEEAYLNDLCGYSEELIKLCGGRSLLLFSSWRNLNAIHTYLMEHTELHRKFRIIKQGEGSTNQLVERFKCDETSVLLGVASLWTGIDVPGRALTGLLIDKIPFSSPADPINQAINEQYQRRGRSVFMERAVPEATIRLRQGVGRLIRSIEDVGLVMILDNRLRLTPYGSKILGSLPEFTRASTLEEVEALNLIRCD